MDSTNDVTFAKENTVLKVHLRMRYSKKAEQELEDLVYDVADDDPRTLIANAPSHSATFKNANRNHTPTLQKFKFSNIFLPSTTQMDFFQLTASPMLEECLNMECNCLLFTYGVTNSGKTYTVQGPSKDAGLIPRSLDLIFNTLGAKIKPKSIYCPSLFNDVVKMTAKLQQQKESVKHRILYPLNTSQSANITGLTDSTNTTRATQGSLLSEFDDQSYQITDNATTIVISDNEDVHYSVWISYVELYNETLYDLLEPPPKDGAMKAKTRPALRLGDDHSMAVYVKGCVQLEITNTLEAYRALAYGNRNKRMAATAMNHSSSRSHSIFKITIIATNTVTQQSQSAQMSFVDLAGSERYGKTNALGCRLKEAGNINTSLLTLGKCISSLRHNQNLKPGQQGLIVPFRESKLTRLFKTFLSGEGSLAMVVCVNPNPECYDETLHALKFSALASEVIYQFKSPISPTIHNEGRLMTKEDLLELEWELREKINNQCCERMRQLREQHIKDIEATKIREMEYHDGVMEDLDKYYEKILETLKDKVRAARAQAAGTDNNANNEEQEKEIVRLKTLLQTKTSELSSVIDTFETQIAHVRLELKTTRSMYKDSLEEKECDKDRFNTLIKAKDAEIQMYFQSNEELTKSATFWEKELTSVKETLARNEACLLEKINERDVKVLKLKKELEDRHVLVRKLTLENQELTTRQQTSEGKAQVDMLREELNVTVENLKKLKQELYKEKEISMSSKEEICQANTRIMELDNKLRNNGEEIMRIADEREKEKEESEKCIARLKSTTCKDKQEIEALQQACSESETIAITLKSDLKRQHELLSEQENAPNSAMTKENSELKEQLLKAEHLINEKEKKCVENSAMTKENSELKEQLLKGEQLINEKEKKCVELEEELCDIVRNKSLQFDSIICNKERELDTVSERNTLYEKEVAELKRRIAELEELASVQKHHLTNVEFESATRLADLQQEYKIKLDVERTDSIEDKKRNEQHAVILEQLDVHNKQLKDKLTKSEEEHARLTGKLTKSEEEYASLMDKLDKFEKDQVQLTEENTRLLEQLNTPQTAPPQDEALFEKTRLDAVLARQELQRVQIELSAAKRADTSRQLQLQLDAKDIELSNWYKEKEKAVTMISVKKEKEIEALQDKIEHLQSIVRENSGEKKDQTLKAAQDQLVAMKTESMRKLEELADMVVQRENEKDYVQNDFDTYKKQVGDLVTEKEKVFNKMKKELESNKKCVEKLNKEKETLQGELDIVRSAQCETVQEEDEEERKEDKAMERTNSSSASRGRSKARKSIGKKRTSQVMISSKTPRLQPSRSRTSRIAVKIPDSTPELELEFATPEPVGVKRKGTFKGLKNLISSGSKKGKSELGNISESDSGAEFQTPPKLTKIPASSGKRKLFKTQISSPVELLPVPSNIKVQDIDKTAPRSSTRSHAQLIKQHLSVPSTRKTRSRVTKTSK